jgi:hypothetical protein
MVARSKSSTAPPPYSKVSQTSTPTTASTINWQSDSYPRVKETDIKNRKEIARLLSNDRGVIENARRIVAKQHGFDQLDKQEQERRMEEAALKRVQTRIYDGQYTSCTYPMFAGFIPKLVFGSVNGLKDPDKEARMVRQLAALREKYTGRQLDSDDDDEEDLPPVKTEDNTKQRKMGEFLQLVETQEPRLAEDNTDPVHEDSDNDQDIGNKTTTANPRPKGRNTADHGSKRNRVEKSHYNSNKAKTKKKESITWRAVSRGQPLSPGSPAANFEHWKPKSNPWLRRVVFRGQIMAEDGKDDE